MGGWKRVAEERATEIERQRERIRELEDRLDARSLTELSYARQVAMPALEDDPEVPMVTDATGLFSWPAPEPE